MSEQRFDHIWTTFGLFRVPAGHLQEEASGDVTLRKPVDRLLELVPGRIWVERLHSEEPMQIRAAAVLGWLPAVVDVRVTHRFTVAEKMRMSAELERQAGESGGRPSG